MKKLIVVLALLAVLSLPAHAGYFAECCVATGNGFCCAMWNAGLALGHNW